MFLVILSSVGVWGWARRLEQRRWRAGIEEQSRIVAALTELLPQCPNERSIIDEALLAVTRLYPECTAHMVVAFAVEGEPQGVICRVCSHAERARAIALKLVAPCSGRSDPCLLAPSARSLSACARPKVSAERAEVEEALLRKLEIAAARVSGDTTETGFGFADTSIAFVRKGGQAASSKDFPQGLSSFADWKAAVEAGLDTSWAVTYPLLAGPVVSGCITLHFASTRSGSLHARRAAATSGSLQEISGTIGSALFVRRVLFGVVTDAHRFNRNDEKEGFGRDDLELLPPHWPVPQRPTRGSYASSGYFSENAAGELGGPLPLEAVHLSRRMRSRRAGSAPKDAWDLPESFSGGARPPPAPARAHACAHNCACACVPLKAPARK